MVVLLVNRVVRSSLRMRLMTLLIIRFWTLMRTLVTSLLFRRAIIALVLVALRVSFVLICLSLVRAIIRVGRSPLRRVPYGSTFMKRSSIVLRLLRRRRSVVVRRLMILILVILVRIVRTRVRLTRVKRYRRIRMSVRRVPSRLARIRVSVLRLPLRLVFRSRMVSWAFFLLVVAFVRRKRRYRGLLLRFVTLHRPKAIPRRRSKTVETHSNDTVYGCLGDKGDISNARAHVCKLEHHKTTECEAIFEKSKVHPGDTAKGETICHDAFSSNGPNPATKYVSGGGVITSSCSDSSGKLTGSVATCTKTYAEDGESQYERIQGTGEFDGL